MRRDRQGATKGPAISRPGAGYGKFCFGAPGPTQEVEPREELVPELFTGEPIDSAIASSLTSKKPQEDHGDTIIDITSD